MKTKNNENVSIPTHQLIRFAKTFLGICLVLAMLEPAYAEPAVTSRPSGKLSIPYVATRNDIVRDMLWLAEAGKDDVVYDLGSGDGRIVIAAVRDFGARRAVGIEKDAERIRESRENAAEAGVTDHVEFIQADLFDSDFREANVVTLFLGHEPNIRLRPKLLGTLKPGARIVSHQFAMGEWEPDKALTVRTVHLGMWGEIRHTFSSNPRVPDYTDNESHFGSSVKLSMWVVPAPVAGIWRGKIETAQGSRDLQIRLTQLLSQVSGRFELSGQTNLKGWVRVDLWGNHVRYWCKPENMGYDEFELKFDGHARGDAMNGTLAIVDHGQVHEQPWEARRDPADFTGTWEWPCASGPRQVQLRIERRDGHYMAAYVDQQVVPVSDFYDFGGGFYFTLLIGRTDRGLALTADNGWLIAGGIVDNGAMKGWIEFHPCKAVPGEGKDSRVMPEKWTPRLVKE